jgi:hypothetical protein
MLMFTGVENSYNYMHDALVLQGFWIQQLPPEALQSDSLSS